MYKIDFKRFEVYNDNYTDAFETLCHHVFCRMCKVTGYIPADYNQKGLETNPVLYKGKYYGYQSKYFEYGMDYVQIQNSIKKAFSEFSGSLDYIYIFYNCKAVISRSTIAKEIENEAKKYKVKIIWFGEASFKNTLNQPGNFDLAQLFFGTSDEFGFISDNTDTRKMVIINSSEYIDLPLIGENNRKVTVNTLSDELLNNKNITIFTGNPGSGKSVCLNKLFQVYSGLDKGSFKERIDTILKNEAIPMIINLKNCSLISLEEIIRNRTMRYNLQSSDLMFIYIFDGLDEVSLAQADVLLTYVYELLEKTKTKKVILSSRKLSQNRILLNKYFKQVDEYSIDNLDVSYLIKFFDVKNDKNKSERLTQLLKVNVSLSKEIEDILLIKLFWDIIEFIDENSTIIEIIARKIDLIFDDGLLKKNLDDLNLPNPKKMAMMDINKEIAFAMYMNSTLSFPLKGIYEIIESKFQKLSYSQINDITNYLCQTLFDSSEIGEDSSFTYQHRRYQEYFMALKLKEEYEKSPCILRKLNLLSNKDFFENFFIKFLKSSYIKENDITGILEIGLFDTYLGSNKAWGADRPWYEYLDTFTRAIAAQDEQQMDSLIKDAGLPITDNIVITAEKVKKDLIDKKNRPQSIPDRTEEILKFLMRNIVEFWKHGKVNMAEYLIEELKKIEKLFGRKYKNYAKHYYKAIYDEFETYLYIMIVILSKDITDILKNIIRQETNRVREYKFRESEAEKINKSFFRICLTNRLDDLLPICELLTADEFLDMLNVLCENKLIHLSQNDNLKEAIISIINDKAVDFSNNLIVSAFKKLYNLPTSSKEINLLKAELTRLQQERWIDIFSFHSNYDWLSILIYILKEENSDLYYGNFDSRYLYQQLYGDYIDLLKGKNNVSYVIKRFCDFSRQITTNKHQNISWWTTNLFVSIFSNTDIDDNNISSYLRYLIRNSNDNVNLLILLKLLKTQNKCNLDNYIIEAMSTLTAKDYKEKKYSTDLSDNADYYFSIAYLYSGFEVRESLKYIIKGLNSSVLRHGWRKDYIVDSNLIMALELMQNNNFLSQEEFTGKVKKIVEMILYLNKITDENYRCGAFERIVSITSQYSVPLCEEIVKTLKEYNLLTNDMLRQFLTRKIVNGDELKGIIIWISNIEAAYGYQDKLTSESFLYKLDIYLTILEVGWYSDNEELIMRKISAQVEALKNHKLTNVPYEDIYQKYIVFCSKYNQKYELSLNEDKYQSKDSDISNENTNIFVAKLEEIHNTKSLKDLYTELRDYKQGIILSKKDMWMKLIDKTFEVEKNLKQFVEYLSNNSYPNMIHYSANSDYMHFGISYALHKLDYKQEVIDYLAEAAGHDGFVNLIKCYEDIMDKEMCKKLFERFFSFCEFLVYE